MIDHIVFIKFKPFTTKIQKDILLDKLKGLEQEIPGIIDLQAGYNLSDKSKGYEMALNIRFKNKKYLENYGPHPKHQVVVKYLQDIGLEGLIIADFELSIP